MTGRAAVIQIRVMKHSHTYSARPGQRPGRCAVGWAGYGRLATDLEGRRLRNALTSLQFASLFLGILTPVESGADDGGLREENQAMSQATEPPVDAEEVRRTVKMCLLKSRVGDPVESVCPPDAVRLLGIEVIFSHGLKLAHLLFVVMPSLGRTKLCEPADLLHELIDRYGSGKRRYRWLHWLTDSRKSDWTKWVFFKMIGNHDESGVMLSIATDELKAYKRKGEAPLPDDADVVDDTADDLDDGYEAALIEVDTLMTTAIRECAENDAFGVFGDKAVEVYRAVYRGGRNKLDHTLAHECGVPEDFVALMRDQGQLALRLRKHCRPRTLQKIMNAILNGRERARSRIRSSLNRQAGGAVLVTPVSHDAGAASEEN